MRSIDLWLLLTGFLAGALVWLPLGVWEVLFFKHLWAVYAPT